MCCLKSVWLCIVGQEICVLCARFKKVSAKVFTFYKNYLAFPRRQNGETRKTQNVAKWHHGQAKLRLNRTPLSPRSAQVSLNITDSARQWLALSNSNSLTLLDTRMYYISTVSSSQRHLVISPFFSRSV